METFCRIAVVVCLVLRVVVAMYRECHQVQDNQHKFCGVVGAIIAYAVIALMLYGAGTFS
jgi:fumarate reductase subunit D